MRFTVIGCAGSFTGRESPASCYLVQAEHEGRTWSIALDMGNGAFGVLQRHLDLGDLDGIILSHLHADHCLDMTGIYVAQRYLPIGEKPDPIPVWAPAGAAARLGRAYGVDEPEDMTAQFDFHDLAEQESFTIGPFTITPHRVYHPVETYGLRVAADGEVLAYTADTDADERVVELCRDASLVLADCAYVDGRDDGSTGVHMSGSQAARVATEAGAARLMLTHMPSWNDPEECRAQASPHWAGTVEIAQPERTYQI